MLNLHKHLQALIAIPSITPHDMGCLDYIETVLKNLGFNCTQLPRNKVSNLYAEYGSDGPLLVFAGHTDVVEPGDLAAWTSPPFELTEKEACYYGRGIADMKGAIAAMLTAVEQGIPDHIRLGFLLTSGEEGQDYMDGTPHVLEWLKAQDKKIDYCIVGEPSSRKTSGDMIKNGRRGSLTGSMLIKGIQGHVAYPHKAKNAIHHALPFLHALTSYQWDHGNAFFEPSSLQITSLEPSTQSSNVIPGQLRVTFNLRFNTLQTASGIKDTILDMARQHALEASFSWELSGHPFLTQEGQLLDQCQNAIASIGGEKAVLSTGGGTSDARFIAAYGIDVIELGLPNASIHQVNEHVAVHEVTKLATIYKAIIDRLHLEP